MDNSIGEGTLVRFIQALQNHLEIFSGNDVYNFTKHDRIQVTDRTIIGNPNSGCYLVEQWNIK